LRERESESESERERVKREREREREKEREGFRVSTISSMAAGDGRPYAVDPVVPSRARI